MIFDVHHLVKFCNWTHRCSGKKDSYVYWTTLVTVFILNILFCIVHLLLEIYIYSESDTMQFGFKKGVSTTQCSWLVNEVTTYFMWRGTAVTACLLDCSKAFDNFLRI